MSQSTSTIMPAGVRGRLTAAITAGITAGRRPSAWALTAAWAVGGAAFLTLMGRIAVPLPFTPVPLALGTLGVWMLATLGGWRGVSGVVTYLVLVMAGVPLLVGGAPAFGATFGYVVAYVPAAALVAWAFRRIRARRASGASRWSGAALHAIALVAASAAVYAGGLAWLMFATGMSLPQAWMAGALPFLLGDALKVAAGTTTGLLRS